MHKRTTVPKAAETGRKQAAEKLTDSEKHYRLLAENAADVIWTVDMNMQPTYISPSITRLLGYSIEEAMNTRMEEAFTNDSFKVALKVLTEELGIEKALQNDPSRSRTLELELNHKNGFTIPVEVKYTFIRDIQGRPVEILAIARDITERKQAEEKLRQTCEKLNAALEGTIKAMVAIVEKRDPYIAGHQQRVSQLACAIAREMGISQDGIEEIRLASNIHDLGKINVPRAILNKTGRLTKIDLDIIKSHPQFCYDILQTAEFPFSVCQIVLQHHERMDGSGYPKRLSGEDILLGARIIAVADVLETMVSERVYRPAQNIEKALEEISKNKGALYDSEVADACLRLFNEKGFEFEKYIDTTLNSQPIYTPPPD